MHSHPPRAVPITHPWDAASVEALADGVLIRSITELRYALGLLRRNDPATDNGYAHQIATVLDLMKAELERRGVPLPPPDEG